MITTLSLALRLRKDEWRHQIALLCLSVRQWLSLIADPALDGLIVRTKLDADHGLVALAVELLIIAALEVVVLLRLHLLLDRVAEVGHVLAFPLGELDYEALIVNHGPCAFLASRLAHGLVQHLHGIVSVELQVQLARVTWQGEFEVLWHDLDPKNDDMLSSRLGGKRAAKSDSAQKGAAGVYLLIGELVRADRLSLAKDRLERLVSDLEGPVARDLTLHTCMRQHGCVNLEQMTYNGRVDQH